MLLKTIKMIGSEIHNLVRDVVDFPKKGIVFKDITTLLMNKDISDKIIDEFITRTSHLKIDVQTFNPKQLPETLKSIPITTPGSRFIK